MVEREEMEIIDKGWRNINIIWVAMLVSLAFYLFVGIYMQDKTSIGKDFPTDALRNVRITLYIVSVITLILIKYIRKSILTQKWGGKFIKSHQPAVGYNQYPAIAKYHAANIVSIAMSGSIGIYGIILCLLGKNLIDLFLLIFVSAVAMLYFRPQKTELISLAKELKEQLMTERRHR